MDSGTKKLEKLVRTKLLQKILDNVDKDMLIVELQALVFMYCQIMYEWSEE